MNTASHQALTGQGDYADTTVHYHHLLGSWVNIMKAWSAGALVLAETEWEESHLRSRPLLPCGTVT